MPETPPSYRGTGDTLNARCQADRLRALVAALQHDIDHAEGLTDKMKQDATERVNRMRREALEWDIKADEWERSPTGWVVAS